MNNLRDALRAQLRKYLAADSAHDPGHADRVWQNAQLIADDEPPCNRRILLAGCYLHDLVVLPKDNPARHEASARSAEKAVPILEILGFSPAEIAATQHAISAHSFSAGIRPQTAEARILQDADRIEALGAVGIARCFAVSGALSRLLFESTDPFATDRPLDDTRYAVDHFACKLLRMHETMQTSKGKRIAQERADVMRHFLDQLAKELNVAPSRW